MIRSTEKYRSTWYINLLELYLVLQRCTFGFPGQWNRLGIFQSSRIQSQKQSARRLKGRPCPSSGNGRHSCRPGFLACQPTAPLNIPQTQPKKSGCFRRAYCINYWFPLIRLRPYWTSIWPGDGVLSACAFERLWLRTQFFDGNSRDRTLISGICYRIISVALCNVIWYMQVKLTSRLFCDTWILLAVICNGSSRSSYGFPAEFFHPGDDWYWLFAALSSSRRGAKHVQVASCFQDGPTGNVFLLVLGKKKMFLGGGKFQKWLAFWHREAGIPNSNRNRRVD